MRFVWFSASLTLVNVFLLYPVILKKLVAIRIFVYFSGRPFINRLAPHLSWSFVLSLQPLKDMTQWIAKIWRKKKKRKNNFKHHCSKSKHFIIFNPGSAHSLVQPTTTKTVVSSQMKKQQ